jgi:hypothetical protein
MSGLVGKLAVMAALAMLSGSVQARGDLLVLYAEFDFGTVPQRSTVAHRFRLVAAGDDTVRVTEIKTGCACIALLPSALADSAFFVAPGDTVTVTLLWQMRLSTGKISRQVLVLTDGNPEPMRVRLEATVEEPGTELAAAVSCQPVRLAFEALTRQRSLSAPLQLANSTGDDLAVVLESEPFPEIQSAIPDTLRSGERRVGSVAIAEALAGTELERSLTFSFRRGNSEVYRRTIPVSLGDFSYRPMGTK